MKFTTVLPALSLAISALAAVPGNMRSKVVCRDEWETNCTYVSKGQIYDIWNGPGGGDFYRNFHEDIDWDVMFTQPLFWTLRKPQPLPRRWLSSTCQPCPRWLHFRACEHHRRL